MIPAANESPLTPLRFLQRSAEVYSDSVAIVYGRRRYTYAEFADIAQRFAQALTARIEPGDRVAFLSPNLPEMLIAHFAVPLAGGILVALNSRLAKAEIDYILEHSGARLLFVDTELLGTLGDPLADAPALTGVIEIVDAEFGPGADGVGVGVGVQSFESFLAEAAPDAPVLPWTVADEREVITIGHRTTGKPRCRGRPPRRLPELFEVFYNYYQRLGVLRGR